MKNEFPGFNKKSKSEINEIWSNAIICFDTNVLLNLYRYSLNTRNELLSLIEKFKDRIWLPHQVALEYNRNRYEVIADQEKTYKSFIKSIAQIENDLKSSSKPPFLSEKLHSKLQKDFQDVKKEVEDSIENFESFLTDDPIYNAVSELFKEKISERFSEEEMLEVFKEGEERYNKKIPPGFEDEKEKDEIKKFGDLVLWKQVLKKAKEINLPILLITDEQKIDWWWKLKDGRNMGPRQELVQEMKVEADCEFHMYSSERFLSYGNTFLKQQVNQKAVEEIKEIKRSDLELNKIEKENYLRFRRNKERHQEASKFYQEQLKNIEHEIASIEKYLAVFDSDSYRENSELSNYLNEKISKLENLKKDKDVIQFRLKSRQFAYKRNSSYWDKLKDSNERNDINDRSDEDN